MTCKLRRSTWSRSSRAARAPRAPRGDGPRARVVPPADQRTRAALAGKGPKTPADRNAWPRGSTCRIPAAEPVYVVFYAGCKYSLEESLRETVRSEVRLLQLAGLYVGLFENGCCGGLADKMGYRDEVAEAGRRMLKQWADAGVKTVVTPCADRRQTCSPASIRSSTARGRTCRRSLHTVECVDQLLKDDRLELTTPVPMTVTYHDPGTSAGRASPTRSGRASSRRFTASLWFMPAAATAQRRERGVSSAPRDVLARSPGWRSSRRSAP